MKELKSIQRYVLGFMFNEEITEVALIRKNRPVWQAGHLNGIGGHVEPGEAPDIAMAREFLEETGAITSLGDWIKFAQMGNVGSWGSLVTVGKEISRIWYLLRTKRLLYAPFQ